MAVKQVNLLHIDDDNIDRMVVLRVMKKFPTVSSIHQVQNGVEALDLLRGTNGKETISPFPNVILLDINMPKMNGLEFLKELRADEKLKHLAVFILTTSNDDHDKMQAHALNVAGYIIKPIDISVFESTFRILTEYWMLCELP